MVSLRVGTCLSLMWLTNLMFLPAKLFASVEGRVGLSIRDVEPLRRSLDTKRHKVGANGQISC
ncbi:hypothetical protein ASF32_22655 [Methylobacterium sp. Leaf91]|nr:hypothetical protein ASF32_22655 [Methylobacterium sp. Leaf91]